MKVETNMPLTYQTSHEKIQTYRMKCATTCGVHSYHVNGYFVQNKFAATFSDVRNGFCEYSYRKFRNKVFAKNGFAKMRQHNFFRFIH
jgi:hypothetical protein